MAHADGQLHCHLVWSTQQRQRAVTPQLEPRLTAHLLSKCRELGVLVHALVCGEGHVHLACSIPPKLAVAYAVATLKGASSHFINQPEGEQKPLRLGARLRCAHPMTPA